jgi:hypothetical protein
MKKKPTNPKKLVAIKDEVWKEIPNTEGIYFISNYGRLKSYRRDKVKGRMMKLSQVKGFHCANIKVNGKYKSCLIHKLVAENFVPKPTKNHTHVCHLDLNVKNNHTSNLSWITREENYRRVMEHLSEVNKNRPGKFAPFSKLKADDVKHIKNMLHLGVKQKVIAKMFCVSEMQITRIKKGVNWAEIKHDENVKTITFR